MPDKAQPTTTVSDWLGLSDVPRSAVNQPPGTASEQINCCCIIEGELIIRRGCKLVTFENLS